MGEICIEVITTIYSIRIRNLPNNVEIVTSFRSKKVLII